MKKVLLFPLLMVAGCTYEVQPACPSTSTAISYVKDVQPIITTRCATTTCHSPKNASTLLTISNYKQVVADLNDIRSRVASKTMPAGTPLSDCEYKTLLAWIDQGALNN